MGWSSSAVTTCSSAAAEPFRSTKTARIGQSSSAVGTRKTGSGKGKLPVSAPGAGPGKVRAGTAHRRSEGQEGDQEKGVVGEEHVEGALRGQATNRCSWQCASSQDAAQFEAPPSGPSPGEPNPQGPAQGGSRIEALREYTHEIWATATCKQRFRVCSRTSHLSFLPRVFPFTAMSLKSSSAPRKRLQRSALIIGGALLLVTAVEAQSRQNLSRMNLRQAMLRFQTSNATGGNGGSTGGNGGVITGGRPRPPSPARS